MSANDDRPDPDALLRQAEQETRGNRWRRGWKLRLIEAENPEWRDLSDGWFDPPEGPLSSMQGR